MPCRIFVLFFLVIASALARAEVAPFGQSVGNATLKEVRESLASQARLEKTSTNRWTGGPMLNFSGAGLGIEGLQRAQFIFNEQETLVGVVLTLPKHRFDPIASYLRSKYKLISAQTPSVGNKLATFSEGAVTIEVDAPHMSFEMEVRYLHQTLLQAYKQGSEAEQTQKARSESEKF